MFITLDDVTLFFDVVGPKLAPQGDVMAEKPTLIVLHGGPGYDHTTLRPYFDRFADVMQVIYIDHRACGQSTGSLDSLSLDRWADDLAAFCAALGIENPYVFGQSFGGMVAMHYAARHPDGPAKLILSSTAAFFRLDETEKVMRRLGGDGPAELARSFFSDPSEAKFKAYSEICVPLYSPAPAPDAEGFRNRAIQRPEVAVHFFQDEMKRMDMRAGIASIACPTLVLGGSEDPVTPVICSEEIAASIGDNAELVIFDNCGHGVHRDEPERAEKVMRAFLTG